MEGWRQRRPGSSAKESTEGKTKTEREKHSYRKEEETFLTLTGLLMEGVECDIVSPALLFPRSCKEESMMLPFDLEDWLTEVGDQIVRKMASEGEAALTEREKLIYEIWLLDTETRNGGLSQYFANRGAKQWEHCRNRATTWPIPSFWPFADRVSELLRGNPDPYLAIAAREAEANELYYAHQTAIVAGLRDSVEFQD